MLQALRVDILDLGDYHESNHVDDDVLWVAYSAEQQKVSTF